MSWHANQLKYALGLGGLMSFYGAVSLVVLLLPPNTFGGRQYQVAVIILVLLTLPFSLLIMFVAARRSKKKAAREAEAKLQPAVEAGAAPPPKPAAPVGSFAGLTSSTEEAVQFLKTSNLGNGGRDAIYSLPWYLVAGAPRAGKSSLVLSSNLNFQTLPSQRQSEQKFVRPTGSVDWRVTSDAVFVDTAGRYQTEGIDSEEWSSLLETIKKYRGNRPVDGFLLVVNTETILKSDEREMEELAKVLRARLDDSMQRLKVRFPVYVVFTHADGIEGFRDSFSTSKNEDKTLVWGATIPIEKSENAQAMFDGEYELLHNSLMKRRIVRLSAPFTPVRQLRIFNFPLHFGTARRKFGAFINALFRPNPFSENPFLRGFYFTASPVGKATGNAPAAVGDSYFTERFFRDVVLRDKDLVKTQIDSRQRAPIMGWMSTILAGIVVFSLLVMSGVSLASNKQLLNEASVRGQELAKMATASAGKNPLEKKEDATREELNETERMRQFLAKLDDYDRNDPPFYMRFGLYSGEKIYKENLLRMYLNVVEQRFREPAVEKLEADLAKFASSKPVATPGKPTEEEQKLLEKHLNMLKAYLMLSGTYKAQAEGVHVASVLKDYWVTESKVPADMKLVAEQQLDFWAKQIDRDDVGFPRIQLNDTLVANTRNKLKDFPAPFRYLSRKVTEVSKQVDDAVGEMTVAGMLPRASSDPTLFTSNYRVPGAYTRAGYDLMKEAIANAEEEMKKDDWVMGEEGKADLAQTSDIARIESKYLTDYAMHWTSLVRSTDVRKYNSRDEALAALQAFAQPDSPMQTLAREIAINTNLSADPDPNAWWPWLKSFVVKKKVEGGNTEPEKAFRPLFDFVGRKDKKSQFDQYATQLNQLYAALNTKTNSDADLKRLGEELTLNDKDTLGVKKRETEVSSLVASFNSTPPGQAMAELLLEPITRLRTQMGAGGKEVLAKTWNDQVLPAVREIEKGYPFDESGSEADLKVLTAFLAPGEGTFSKFYDEKLKNYFEVANGQYRVKDGSEFQFSDQFVAYVNNAFKLQEAMFGKSSTPKFEYDFAFKPVKEAVIEITIDGQKTTSEGTGSLKGTFPGANASETGVIMKLASTSGTTSTEPAPSANSSNSNVSSVSGSPSGGSGELIFQGQWGLFKFVDRGSPEKQPDGSYLLKYQLGGKAVTATIKASGGDLFDKSVFRQVKAPQEFLK